MSSICVRSCRCRRLHQWGGENTCLLVHSVSKTRSLKAEYYDGLPVANAYENMRDLGEGEAR